MDKERQSNKVIINTHFKKIKEWLQFMTQQQKKWNQINNTLISQCTSWLNERQGLRIDFALLDQASPEHRHSVEEVYRMTNTNITSYHKKAYDCILLFRKLISETHKYTVNLEDIRNAEHVEMLGLVASDNNANEVFPNTSIRSTGDATLELSMNGNPVLFECGDGWDGRDRLGVDSTVYNAALETGKPVSLSPCPTPSVVLTTVCRVMEWHSEWLSMWQEELTAKLTIIDALFAKNHKQYIAAYEYNLQLQCKIAENKRKKIDNWLNKENEQYTSNSLKENVNNDVSLHSPSPYVIGVEQLQQITPNMLNLATRFKAFADQTSYVPEPHQMSMYLTTLSLEPYIDSSRIDYITNACQQTLMTQLSID